MWNPFRSKLAAAVLAGLDNIYIKPGMKVLYLGAASGTSVSHCSDIVGPEGAPLCCWAFVICAELPVCVLVEMPRLRCNTQHASLWILRNVCKVRRLTSPLLAGAPHRGAVSHCSSTVHPHRAAWMPSLPTQTRSRRFKLCRSSIRGRVLAPIGARPRKHGQKAAECGADH